MCSCAHVKIKFVAIRGVSIPVPSGLFLFLFGVNRKREFSILIKCLKVAALLCIHMFCTFL